MVFSVLCSGLKRSASTWSFNVCRELLDGAVGPRGRIHLVTDFANDTDRTLRRLVDRYRDDPREVCLLIKAHELGPATRRQIDAGKLRNVYTVRDPRDCLASLERFWPRRDDQPLETRLRNFQRWLMLGEIFSGDGRSHVVRYETMLADPEAAIDGIARYIGVRPTRGRIVAIARSTSSEALGGVAERVEADQGRRRGAIDPVTQIHAGHIDGGEVGRWRTDLDADTARRATIAFLPWLVSLGYDDETVRAAVAALGS